MVPIYIKFKNRQHETTALEVRIAITLTGRVVSLLTTGRGQKEDSMVLGRFCFLVSGLVTWWVHSMKNPWS